ncbi:MAG: hypothetical protein ABIQ97_06260 [Lysobacteraceae bacterium]
MKTFLAVFTGTKASRAQWDALDAQARSEREKAGMLAWQQWMTDHQDILVDKGGPLGKTKQASHAGISDISNNMGGYVKVRAESHEAAAQLFENHPSFAIFPGEGVEVMEVMPIPTM